MEKKDLVQKLLDAGAQFGHKTSRFNPDMTPYVWGVRNGMHLIDVNKTAFLVEHACKQIEQVAAAGGQILWVGTKRQIQKILLEVANKLKHPSVIHRWIGGTLTNSDQVRKAITKLLHMRDVIEKPLPSMKKKQIAMLKKDLDRLEKNVSGIVSLRTPPALLVVVDVKREITAVKEARTCKVPVIAVVDSNSSTLGVDTIIPANDDSAKSVELILEQLAEAAAKGQAAYYQKYPDRQKRDELAFEKKLMPEKPARKPRQENRSYGENAEGAAPSQPAKRSFTQRRGEGRNDNGNKSFQPRRPNSGNTGNRDNNNRDSRPPRSFSGTKGAVRGQAPQRVEVTTDKKD